MGRSIAGRSFVRPRILRAALVAALAALAVWLPAAPAAAWTVPPPPTLVDVNPSGNAGDWLIGAVPPNFDPSKPVIVFVQGLHGSADDWWGPTMYYGNNDMYAYAYNNGYRTAFVQFRDADGSAGSMWLNGSVLRTQLEAICRWFGVSKVDIVAHSKGGIDSQAAIVHYGAYPYVQNVFTLASPHRGSQLADLCYSWWAWWLAALLGQRDDGTYVMQTSYMDYFRYITDNRPEDANVRYYTGAGTDWGPWFSAMWFGGNYLWFYDANDGVVCLYSAHGLPNGTRVFTDGSCNHDNIRMGSKTWKYIAPYLGRYQTSATSTAPTASTAFTASTAAAMSAGTINAATLTAATLTAGVPAAGTTAGLVRGGPVSGTARTRFAVESGVLSLEVSCLVGSPAASAWLVAPDGTRIPLALGGVAGAGGSPAGGGAGGPLGGTTVGGAGGVVGTPAVGEYFGGAAALGAVVNDPLPGDWSLEVSSPVTDAYLATIDFVGGAALRLGRGPAGVYRPGETVRLQLEALGSDGLPLVGLDVSGVAVATEPGKGRLGWGPDYGLAARFRLGPSAAGGGLYEGGFKLPGREGVYNLTIDVAGSQGDGTSLNRTLVLSVLVLRPEHRNAAGLEGLLEK